MNYSFFITFDTVLKIFQNIVFNEFLTFESKINPKVITMNETYLNVTTLFVNTPPNTQYLSRVVIRFSERHHVIHKYIINPRQ